jgi:hypothetical protein
MTHIIDKKIFIPELESTRKALTYNDKIPVLVGSAIFISQPNFSDYDMITNIKRYDNDEFRNIFKRVSKLKNIFLIEIKIQYLNDDKIKFGNYKDFEIEDYKNIDYIKIDYVVNVKKTLKELSCIYTAINKKGNRLDDLKKDMEELKKEGNYYKAMKRQYNIFRVKLQYKKMVTLNDKLFDNEYGELYSVMSTLEAVVLLNDKYPDNRRIQTIITRQLININSNINIKNIKSYIDKIREIINIYALSI